MARKAKAELPSPEGETSPSSGANLIELAVGLVSSYVSRNQVPMADLPAVIGMFHGALAQAAGRSGMPAESDRKPAVSVKKSIGDDFIICLEDGKKLTMLKRYLRSQYDMSPEDYRKKWELPHDYPMVAPAYARLRSAFAKKIGLGRIATPGRGRRPKAV